MKQIKRSKIVKKIKEAYKEGRDWCRHDFGRYYQIMIDTYDADIWCDVFLDNNHWTIYHSDTIQQLDTIRGYVQERENGYVDSAIELLTAAGWTVID